MGTFEQIRRTSPYILALFAVVFIAFMVISDMQPEQFIGQRGNPQTEPIAVVNGEEIIFGEFSSMEEQRIARQRESMKIQGAEEIEVEELPIRKRLWEEMIRKILIKQQAEKEGIIVTDKEVYEEMITNPPMGIKEQFQDSAGNYNPLLFARQYSVIVRNPNGFLEESMKRIKERSPEITQEQLELEYRKLFMAITSLMEFEQNIPFTKKEKELQSIIGTASSFVSPNYARKKFIDENGIASVDFFFFDINSIADSTIQVSDEDISKYYDANKKYFEQEPARKLVYASFPMAPSKEDTLALEKVVQTVNRDLSEADTPGKKDTVYANYTSKFPSEITEYKLLKDFSQKLKPYISGLDSNQIAGPIAINDSVFFIKLTGKREGDTAVKASHILLKSENVDNLDSLKREADKIYRQASEPGADFAELARKHSQDEGSAMQGGDVGYFGRGRMVAEFTEAAFAAEKGQVTKPVKTQFGYHIIKVEDKTSAEYRISMIKLGVKASDRTKRNTRRKVNQFFAKLQEGGDFYKLAEEYGAQAQETEFFLKTMPVLNSLYFSALAFQSEVGTAIDPRRTREDDRWYIMQVSDARNAGIKPLEDVKDEIKAMVIVRKKKDLLMDDANALYQKISSGTSLSMAKSVDSAKFKSIESLRNNGSVSGIGQDYVFTSKAFSAPAGKITEPFKGEKGVYILQVKNRTIPEEEEKIAQGAEEKIKTLQNTSKNRAFNSWFEKLKNESRIEDYRSNWYTEY